jgi:hypothetical protein
VTNTFRFAATLLLTSKLMINVSGSRQAAAPVIAWAVVRLVNRQVNRFKSCVRAGCRVRLCRRCSRWAPRSLLPEV